MSPMRFIAGSRIRDSEPSSRVIGDSLHIMHFADGNRMLRRALNSLAERAGLAQWSRDTLGARRQKAARQRAHAFYRQLIPPGSVVFDIGANVGDRADVFRK